MTNQPKEQTLSSDDRRRCDQLAEFLSTQEWTEANPATLKDMKDFIDKMSSLGGWDLLNKAF